MAPIFELLAPNTLSELFKLVVYKAGWVVRQQNFDHKIYRTGLQLPLSLTNGFKPTVLACFNLLILVILGQPYELFPDYLNLKRILGKQTRKSLNNSSGTVLVRLEQCKQKLRIVLKYAEAELS